MMFLSKKRKTTFSLFQDKTAPEREDKPTSKSIILTEEDLVFIKQIETHLKLELFNLLIYKLDGIKQEGKLFALLEHDDFRLLSWALEHKNLGLIHYLKKNLSSAQYFIMLQQKDYVAVKTFINHIKNLEWDVNFEQTILPIFDRIVEAKPNWQIIEVIENCFSNSTAPSNSNTLLKLKAYIKNKQSYFEVSSIDKEKNTEVNSGADLRSS